MFENFIKTYPNPKNGPVFKFTTTVRHNGTIVAFAVNSQRRILYSVLDLGDQRAKGPIDVNYWNDNPTELIFPNEVITVGEGLVNPRAMPVYKLGSPAPVTDGSRVKDSEKDFFRSTTASLSADAPIQVLSDNRYIYIFRQSVSSEDVGVAADTLLVDRFILSGTVLKAKPEVRYQRSRNKYRPESNKDGLGAKDMEQKPFFEPTQKLEFIHNLKDGRFTALIVPTQISNIQRWQFFAYNSKTKMVDSFNIERSSDGLFNLAGSQLFVRPESEIVPALNGESEAERVFIKEGYAEWALHFNGDSTAINTQNPLKDGDGNATFEFWINPDAFTGMQTLLAGEGQAAGMITIDETGELLLTYAPASENNPAFGSGAKLEASAWTHVALVIDADEKSFTWYINGEQKNTLANAEFAFETDTLVLGSGTAGNFSGLLDELRIWIRARFAEEIMDNMQHRLIGYEPGLALYWRFDEGSGSTVHDQTEHAVNGAISGDVEWLASDAPVGDHPGVRRSGFGFDGRDIVTGMSALLYYHQEKNKSGYNGEEKPLKTKARIMLALATHPKTGGDAGKNNIATLDIGLSRDGKLAQIPDNIILKDVQVTGESGRSSREIQQEIAFWEQRESDFEKLVAEFDGEIELEGDDFLSASFRRLPVEGDDETEAMAEAVTLIRNNITQTLSDDGILLEETDADTTPQVLSMASWQYETGEIATFRKVDAPEGITITAEESVPDEEDEEGEPIVTPPEKIVGTEEWLALWCSWINTTGSGEAAVYANKAFYYFIGNKYRIFDWESREFNNPTLIKNGPFPELWESGVDAMHNLEDGSIIFFKGLRYKKYKRNDEGNFELKEEEAINKLYKGTPFLFLYPEYKEKKVADIETELTANLTEAQSKLSQLAGELAAAQARELKNLEVEVEMFLIHNDIFGLSTMGGLLDFAWSKSTPLLFDSADGKLALYFQGTDDQFFVTYYDTMTNAANFHLPANNSTDVMLIPRLVAPMIGTKIEVSGTDSDVCDVKFSNANLDIDESWQNIPRASDKFASVINGGISANGIGVLEKPVSGLIDAVDILEPNNEFIQPGYGIALKSYLSVINRITPKKAVKFGTASKYLELKNIAVADSGTLEMWIQFNGTADQAIFDTSDSPSGKYFAIHISEGELAFDIENAADDDFKIRKPMSELNVGSDWHYLAATWQFDGTMAFYLDGELLGEIAEFTGQRPDFQNPFVGKPRGDYYTAGNFKGQLAELVFHTDALNAEDIAAHFVSGVFTPKKDVVADWRFQEVDDKPAVVDFSDNKNESTLHGITNLEDFEGGGVHLDINPVQLRSEIPAGTAVYSIRDFGLNTAADGETILRRSMFLAADASKAEGQVQNISIEGSTVNSPLPRWVAYAQGSTLQFNGIDSEVKPKNNSTANFEPEGDVTMEAWVRPQPVVGSNQSSIAQYYSGDTLYFLGSVPKRLESAMYFNATDASKAYAWAGKQTFIPFLGTRHWAFDAANAAISASDAGKSVSEIIDAAENAARDAINPFYFFFHFWSNYERDRVGELARDWAKDWARTHNDYVECRNQPYLNPNTDQWSIELWFRADRTVGENILYNKERLFETQVFDGQFQFAWHPHWVWSSAFSVSSGQWYHAAVVYDGMKQRVYKNGQLVFEREQTGNINSTDYPFLIGARYLGNNVTRFFKGAIDEVRIWAEARSQEQILNNINKRLRGDERNLVGYWHFEEGLARDFSPNKNNGLLHDTPYTVNSIMPGYAIVAGVGNKIENVFSESYVQSRDAIPYFDWNHIAAAYNASYALRFVDPDAFVDAGSGASLDLSGDMTIEVFFRLDDLTEPRGIFSKGRALSAYALYVDLRGRLVFTFADENQAEQKFVSTLDSAIQTGKNYRVAVVRRHQSQTRDVERTRRINGENVTVNIPEVEEWDDIEIHICEWDGSKYSRRFGVAQKYGGSKAGKNNAQLEIGRGSGRNSAPFKGVMSEVRVWSRGLGQMETCQNIIGVESGLVSWWRFEENEGYSAEDFTGTNHATINLADWVMNPDPLGPSFKLYNNGVLMESTQRPALTGVRTQQGFRLGRDHNSSKTAFRGTMEEMRIWRTERTQEQIQDNMFLRLIGEKEDLIAYYQFDKNEENLVSDLSFRGNHLAVKNTTLVVSDAPIGYDTFKVRNTLVDVETDFHDKLQGQPGVEEYGDIQFDSEGNLIGILKRCYSFIQNGQWFLMTGYKVGNLVTEWIGQVQFNPELKGYVEGAPPVPSENLTAGPINPDISDYTGIATVEVIEAENVAYTYSTSKEAGLNASFGLSAKFGVDTTVLLITAPLGIGTATEISDVNVLVGLEGKFDAAAGWSSENTVGVGRNLTKSTLITLGGNWEDPTKQLNTAMRRRYQPANVGFALVQSETADVFALRLEHNLALVSFQFRPNPDIPKDWNIIPFPINPRYTKQGTLDGAVGYDQFGKVLDPDYPNAAQYGQHSYFKPKEAYSIKNRITKEEQELINYFRSVDTNLGGAPDLAISAGLGLIEGAAEGGASGAIEGLVDALGSSGLPEKIGKQNIANTYVWTADGGFFAETTEVTSMKQETTGGSFNFSGEVGASVGVDFSVAGVDVSLGFSAMLGGSLNLTKTKTKSSESSFSLEIMADVPGDLQAYDENLNSIYDSNGNPVIVAGKVDAYRFITFYLEPTNENFDTFFNQVVDPIWLAGNHPNALALKQAQQSDKKPPCWRVMHRVTFVSRILPEIPPDTAPPIEKNMKAANVESNWQLIQKLEPFVRNKRSSYLEFSNAVRDAIEKLLPELKDNVTEIIQFLGAYYQVFEE